MLQYLSNMKYLNDVFNNKTNFSFRKYVNSMLSKFSIKNREKNDLFVQKRKMIYYLHVFSYI